MSTTDKKSGGAQSLVLIVFILVAIGLFVLLYLNRPAIDTTESGRTPVAALLNLTGPSARFDAVKQQTLEIAQQRIIEIYGDTLIDLMILDAGSGGEATTAAVNQALQRNAKYILSGTSPVALAIAAQVRTIDTPLVQMANAANPDFGPPRPGEYRLWPDWNHEAEIVLEILQEQSFSNVLLIHSTDPYSEALKAALESAKGDEIQTRTFPFDPATTPDFRPALLRALQDETDVVVVFGLPPGIRSLIAQMAEVNWGLAMIGGVNINLAVGDFDAAGLEGPLWVIETATMRDSIVSGSEAQSFREEYRSRFGEAPPFHALYLADALYFIADAESSLSNASADTLDVVEKADLVEKFKAASGEISISPTNTLRYDMSARKIR